MWPPCLVVNSFAMMQLLIFSPLTSLASRTTDQGVIFCIDDRTNYIAAYKEEVAAQDNVGARMSMVSEK